jgi:hypothetical protein
MKRSRRNHNRNHKDYYMIVNGFIVDTRTGEVLEQVFDYSR